MNRIQAIHNFWNSFGWVAYDEYTVPDNALESMDDHYITYGVSDAGWEYSVPMTASLWYRSPSWKEITEKAMEIGNYITRGGIMLHCDEGAIWIKKASTWAQRMADEAGSDIRRIVLSIEVEYIVQ